MKAFDPTIPFNDLPLLPPAADIETSAVLKACIEAHKELAKLKTTGKLVPNQTVLTNSISLLESQASSSIENIVTTTDELFEYAQDDSAPMSPSTKETLRYRHALYEGCQLLKERPLTIPLVCKLCSIIRRVETDVRKVPGTALVHDRTGEKIYTPPEGERRLRDLLSNWQDYLNDTSSGIDPLIRLAIQHYQFEAIHPFSDGNGRTGRIINLLYVIHHQLLDTPILYMSGHIIRAKGEYYQRLLQVTTEGAWVEWILYFLNGVYETSKWTLSKISAIQELIHSSSEFLRAKAPSIYSKEPIELLFTQPYIRIHNLASAFKIGRDTASKHLKLLSAIGFLEEVKRGREKLFINHAFLNLLRTNLRI